MSLVKTIVGILLILIILYLLFSWLFQDGTKISSMEPGTNSKTISASKLPDNNTSNYTYSTWFYVNDWNYEFGKEKILLARQNSNNETPIKITLGAAENNINIEVLCYDSTSSTGTGSGAGSGAGADGGGAAAVGTKDCPVQCKTCYSGKNYQGGVALTNGTCTKYCSALRKCGTTDTYQIGGVDCTKCTPTVPPAGSNANSVWPSKGIDGGLTKLLGSTNNEQENTLSSGTLQNEGTTSGISKKHKCTVRNFPLQKWVNLTVSLYGRTLDVYMDGKLVRTCILPGASKSGTGGNILVTPGKGFDGWTSQTRYWADATNPQQAYNIYREGYGGSIIGNLFNKYRVRISFLEDNQTKGSFEI